MECPYLRGVGIRMVAQVRWARQIISRGSIYRLHDGPQAETREPLSTDRWGEKLLFKLLASSIAG